jgi:glycosyltransferase involved in cell wall biosynthesis
MKVLFLGVYRDGTGWGHAAIEYILALDAAGVEVVPRAVKLNDVDAEVPDRIAELEKRSAKGCDVVIQNLLPQHMDYDGNFDKNIALYYSETSHFKNNCWAERLNLMDEAWGSCTQMVDAARESNVFKPMRVMPIPTDPMKYQQQYETLDIPDIKDKFVFYYIGELNRRKNLVALLKAFHLEFRPHEPVELVVKGSVPGLHSEETRKHMIAMCNDVKQHLKLYGGKDYKHEILISERLTDEQIMQLHHTCDCLVAPSYGEAWHIPSFDAMGMGNTPICTDIGGMADFVYKEEMKLDYDQMHFALPTKSMQNVTTKCGWLVPGQVEPVFGMGQDGSFQDLYVGNEEWISINIRKLRQAMRTAYEDQEERKKRANNGIQRAYEYSHAAIGQKMKDALEDNLGNHKYILNSDKIQKAHDIRGLMNASSCTEVA